MVPAWVAIVFAVSYMVVLAINICTLTKQRRLIKLQHEIIGMQKKELDLCVEVINMVAFKAGINPVQTFNEVTATKSKMN